MDTVCSHRHANRLSEKLSTKPDIYVIHLNFSYFTGVINSVTIFWQIFRKFLTLGDLEDSPGFSLLVSLLCSDSDLTRIWTLFEAR